METKNYNVSFAHEIKLEVLKNKMSNSELQEFLKGVIFANSHFQNEDSIILRISDAQISTLLKQFFHKAKIPFNNHGKNKNWFSIAFQYLDLDKAITLPRYFFAGVFVGSGSIVPLYSASYHLQISTWYESIVNLMQTKLQKHFKFNVIKRDDRFVLYLKKAESISDFLKSIGAIKSFYKFEDEKIHRDISNSSNRQWSLDFRNQERLVEASQFHIENFNLVKKHKLEHLFKKEQLEFYALKKENPFTSLSELVILLEKKKGIKKTKSCLNHWLIKLRKVTENI
ncbi:DNA-binding protein WhiA [Candidatus Mycoplasma pogonae]